MNNQGPSLRRIIGCWAHERWLTELILQFPGISRRLGLSWQDLKNRRQKIEFDAGTGGRILREHECSQLTVARIFPAVGGRLLIHCQAEWPVSLASEEATGNSNAPDLSVIIGVRGTSRMAQFEKCIESLRGQQNANVEIIVVEQSWVPQFAGSVHETINYIHQKTLGPDMPFNRSWAFNAGVRESQAPIVVLHDADMIVPRNFAEAIISRMPEGIDALRLPRFIFYLDQETSRCVQTHGTLPKKLTISRVIANNRTPVAVKREKYFAIGGHDEAFYGWGAEDDEFIDRLRTLRISEGAFMPIIHLWHEEAPKAVASLNIELLRRRRALPMSERISELSARDWGRPLPSILPQAAKKSQ